VLEPTPSLTAMRRPETLHFFGRSRPPFFVRLALVLSKRFPGGTVRVALDV